jgi:hypothetical protein
VKPLSVLTCLIVILLLSHSFGQATLSAAIGVRSKAMGSCGYALSDDETSLFYNPAGLGLQNDRWNGGAVYWSSSYYYGTAQNYYGIAYQNENAPKLGFSIYLNQFGNGEDPHENTVSAGGGYNLFSNDLVQNAIGAAVKYYRYYYDFDTYGYVPWKDDAHTSPVAFDAGYLLQFINRFRVGIVFKNIGPDITDVINDSLTEKFRLPLVIATAFGYKDAFNLENLRVLDLSAEISLSNLYGQFEGNGFTIQTGIDLQFLRIFSLQFGYWKYLDYPAYYLSWGTGFSIYNHFEFNVGFSKMCGGGDYENDLQMGISTAFKRMLNWSAKDRKWLLD